MMTAFCTRCGYDLSGTVGSWPEAGACPLHGVCSECGGAIDWASQLSGGGHPPWHWERGRRPSLRRLMGTWIRAWRPGRFWAPMRPVHEVRVGRVVAFAVLCLLSVHVAFMASAVIQPLTGRFGQPIYTIFDPNMPEWGWDGPPVGPNVGVRPQPPIVSRTWFRSARQAAIWPYRAVRRPGYTSLYQPVLGWTALQGACWLLLMPAGMALALAARRQRLSWRHHARIAAYSLAAPCAVAAVWTVATSLDSGLLWAPFAVRRIMVRLQVSDQTVLAPALVGAWLVAWWGFAASRYLAIARPWRAATVATAAAGLMSAALTHVCWERAWWLDAVRSLLDR